MVPHLPNPGSDLAKNHWEQYGVGLPSEQKLANTCLNFIVIIVLSRCAFWRSCANQTVYRHRLILQQRMLLGV